MKRNTYLEMLAKQKDLLSQKGYDFATFQSKSILERYEILHSLQEEYLGSDKPINHIRPIISVCIPTYQQHDYIRGCIEGALMQQTSFPFEIVVGDDGSVDGTTEICMEYAEKYPDKIRFYNRTRELCRVFDEEGHIEIEQAGNWWWTLQDGRGKYIAICEGDDYWIDPLKLQKQVDFLEGNPEYIMCFHNAIKYFVHNNNVELFDRWIVDKDLSMYDAVHNWFVATASIVCKKEMVCNWPDWLVRIYSSDYTLVLYCSHMGRVRYLNQIMSVYRFNLVGSSATAMMQNRYIFMLEQKIDLLCSFNLGTNGKYSNIVNSRIAYLKKEIKFHNAKKRRNFLAMFMMLDVVFAKVLNRIKYAYKK